MKTKAIIFRSSLCALLGLVTILGRPTSAKATDKYTTGRVGAIVVNNQGWISFHLEGTPTLCSFGSGGANTWAQLTTNYLSADVIKQYLTVLNTAKLSGRQLTVRGVNANVAGEWSCRIDALDLL